MTQPRFPAGAAAPLPNRKKIPKKSWLTLLINQSWLSGMANHYMMLSFAAGRKSRIFADKSVYLNLGRQAGFGQEAIFAPGGESPLSRARRSLRGPRRGAMPQCVDIRSGISGGSGTNHTDTSLTQLAYYPHRHRSAPLCPQNARPDRHGAGQ